MPFIRRSRRTRRTALRLRRFRRRRRFVRRRRARRNTALMNPKFSVYTVPLRKTVKFKYTAMVTLDPGNLDTVAVHRFRANGLHDPDFETGGHQPLGYDEWMAFYDHSTVIGSAVKVTFTQIGNPASENPALVGISLNDDETLGTTSPIDLIERPYTNWATLGESYNSNSTKVLKLGYSARKFQGISHPLSETALRGTVGSNPSEYAIFHVWASNMQNSADPLTISCLVELVYTAVLTEPRDLTAS